MELRAAQDWKTGTTNESRTVRPAEASPRLEVVRDEGPKVIGHVMSDGSIQLLDAPPGKEAKRWSEGSVSGKGWILWWTRRSFA